MSVTVDGILGPDGKPWFSDDKGFQHVVVRDDGALKSGPNRLTFFSQLLKTSAGVTNQGVNGSVTPVISFIAASPDFDIHIMKILIKIQDTAVTHQSFGNISLLTNGFDILSIENGIETFFIEKAKTGGDVIIQSATTLAWGDDASSFELTNITGTEDATVVVIPVSDFIPKGLRLGRDSRDLLCAVVNDDLTGLTDFTIRAIGFKHFP